RIPQPKQSFWKVYLAPLMNTLIVIYLMMTVVILILAIIYMVFIDPSDTSIWITAIQWLLIVGANFLIAIIQQQRAQKQIEALHKMSAPSARVIRDGKEAEISTEDVVPGDILILTQGDKIPADSRIIKSNTFRINESSLTGESVPATKLESGDKALEKDALIGERKNMVYTGTFVTMGNSKLVVVNTGERTEFGKISLELAELNTGEIPIRQKVNLIGNYLAAGMVIVFSLLLIYQATIILDQIENGLLDLSDPKQVIGVIIFSLSNLIIKAMSVVPINIPLLTTIILITGVLAMAKHRVIIRNLAAIESLGRISILCSDKTGTITAGQMTVKGIWDATDDEHYYVTGLGYSPKGHISEISDDQSKITEKDAIGLDAVSPKIDSSLGMIIFSGMLNNDSKINEEQLGDQVVYTGTGSPTESALMTLFNKSGFSESKILKDYGLKREFPFDSSLKRMSKAYKKGKENYLFCKGATEVLLPLCSNIGYGKNQRPITESDKSKILSEVEEVASQGYRVLSLTYRVLRKLPPKNDEEREKIESDLCYLGFVKVLDPPRDYVDDSVREARDAGITPIMITGDSPITATSIAGSIGLMSQKHQTHEGKMATLLNDPDFRDTRVFARVAPQDKQIIIQRYQNQNRVVAMTGDGVNDALALSMADAGIAMGIAGTEVSKQAADLVIADDSFNSIVTGIREGRALFLRIRVIIFFFIAINLAEAAVYIGSSFVSGFIPGFELMDHLQRAYIFAIAHTIPPLALILDKIPRDIMKRTPIDSAGIFNKKLALTLIATVISLSAAIYIVYFSTFFNFIGLNSVNQQFFIPIFSGDPGVQATNLRPLSWNHAKARTMMHTVLYLAIPLIVLSIRRIDKSFISAIREDSYWVTYILAFGAFPIHLILMYIPGIQSLVKGIINIDIIGLSISDWGICLVGAIIPVLMIETAKWINRSRGEYF
ncbi:MAG: cation-transporting P-type ATPase, partial [Candidatus Heimdallarchaeota archaeon]|nr:cation-transporting P-type ATPase [Candidatus Heimdallarchaeota archaeon]